MKRKLFRGIIPVALFGIFYTAGCNQSAQTTANPNANTGVAENSDAAKTSEGTNEIKRTELTENAKFAAELKIEPEVAEAGKEATLVFTVKDKQGAVVKDLKIVHEKPMHLLVVSDDLAQFVHVHPEQQADGSFRLSYKFPGGGTFKLYADFTPQNSPQVVNVFDISVRGTKPAKAPLVADTNFTKTIDGLTFTLKAGQPIKAATGTMLDFYVTDAVSGKAITDLQLYLGAMAHFVVISEDTSKFLHVHAMEGKKTEAKGTGNGGHENHGDMEMDVKADPNTGGNPTVQAHTEFPTSGLYKLWGQFQRGGKIFTVPFVLNIAENEKKTAENKEIPKDAVKVTISAEGYTPASIPAKKGQSIKLAFIRKDANNCGGEVVFPKLNIKKQLPVGETVLVEITPQESGEISFACGMDMMKGKILVQ